MPSKLFFLAAYGLTIAFAYPQSGTSSEAGSPPQSDSPRQTELSCDSSARKTRCQEYGLNCGKYSTEFAWYGPAPGLPVLSAERMETFKDECEAACSCKREYSKLKRSHNDFMSGFCAFELVLWESLANLMTRCWYSATKFRTVTRCSRSREKSRRTIINRAKYLHRRLRKPSRRSIEDRRHKM
jgi:hypothetical protein